MTLVGHGTSTTRSARANKGRRVQAGRTGTFKIAGRVTGLYPGATRPLALTVHNPQAFPIIVTFIATSVESAGASCPASDLSVSSFSGQLPVPAFGSAKTSVAATLLVGATDGCIGSSFPLVYDGLARKP